MKSHLGNFTIVCLALALAGLPAAASGNRPLTVAISLDIPPYVVAKATGGLEIDILAQALEGYRLRFIQLPYQQLQTAVPRGRADVSVGVQRLDDGAFYSADFITFVNYAITRKSAGLKIDRIADLAPHRVLTWQNAYMDLGGEFAQLFAPGSPHHANYVEVADQAAQVRRFWESRDTVIVIDRTIFDYFSRAMGYAPDEEAALHPVFPPVTDFKIAFRDPALRDRFNEGLARLCRDGGYARLLSTYKVQLEKTVCDEVDGAVIK